jgi:hypothetical protein
VITKDLYRYGSFFLHQEKSFVIMAAGWGQVGTGWRAGGMAA